VIEILGMANSADFLELRRLAEVYASGADRRDADAFWGVFDPDQGRLLGRREVTDLAGAQGIMDYLARYARSYHFIGNTRYDTDGEQARGEVYCVAHHLSAGANGGEDYVMYIRYQDSYIRRPDDQDGARWRIRERRIVVDWTETVPAGAPGAH
jgi:hypothetical protein